MKKFLPPEANIGVLLILVGSCVMLGWTLHYPALILIHLGWVKMVFNTALCLVSIGIAFILPDRSVRWRFSPHKVIGTFLILFAGICLSANFFESCRAIDEVAIHSWMLEDNPWPGRMSPNSALGFMLTGAVLILKNDVQSRWMGLTVQIATFGVMMLGLTAIVGYSFQFNLLFPKFNAPRMALTSAGCMLLVSLGLWSSWRRADWYQSRKLFGDGEKISCSGIAILTAAAVSVGIAGLAAQKSALERSVAQTLPVILESRTNVFKTAIQHAISNAANVVDRSDLLRTVQQAIASPTNSLTRASLEEIGNNIIKSGITGIDIYDTDNRSIMRTGQFSAQPEIKVMLGDPASRSLVLVWDGKLLINNQMKLIDHGTVIGSIVIEQPLAMITGDIANNKTFGTTGETAICARQSENLVCLPTPRIPKVYTVMDKNSMGLTIPMGLAIAGNSGIYHGRDYRDHNVIAAYAPIAGTGFSIVVKQDTDDLYEPIRRQLRWTVPLLLTLVATGAIALHMQLKPLVAKLLLSERDAIDKERRIRTVVDNVGDGIITINEFGLIETFNNSATEIFGYAPEEVIGKNLEMLMPEELRAAHDAGLKHHLETGETHVIGKRHAELTGLRKNGTIFDLELNVNKMHLGERSLFVGILRDVTDRKRANEVLLKAHADLETRVGMRTQELQKTNERLVLEVQQRKAIEDALQRAQLILTHAQSIAHLGSWQMPVTTRKGEWSDEFWRICGYDPATVEKSGEMALNALHPEDRGDIRATVREILRTGGVYRRERRIVRPDGSMRHVISQGEVIVDENAQPTMLIGTILDVTDYKNTLTALESSEIRLREMAAHQDRIEQDERKRVAREIHDELGGVLTGIKSYLSYLIEQAEQQRIAPDRHLIDAAALANSAIDTVRRIITDLRPSVLDHLGLWAALEWYGGQVHQRTGLLCEMVIDGATASTTPDPDRSTAIFRIVQESLTNVTRHAHAVRVTIRARTIAGKLNIEIQDDGIGIDPPEKRNHESWGIVGMVERARYFGGDLEINGVEGGGTMVTLRMPTENANG